MDVSHIHHSPEHSDALVDALADAGRRSVFGYFEGWGERARYPADAARVREQYFSSDDQLLTMVMGGEIYLPGYDEAWRVAHFFLNLTMHIGIYDEPYLKKSGPLSFQREFAAKLQHWRDRDYPTFST
ncbi:MAG: hypothetical protein ACOH2J_14010 [Allorhizobium sp.]